jgi:hypothetical protein
VFFIDIAGAARTSRLRVSAVNWVSSQASIPAFAARLTKDPSIASTPVSPIWNLRLGIGGVVVCGALGIFLGVMTKRLPMRGWAALLAMLATGLLFMLLEPSDPDKGTRTWLLFPVLTAMPCISLYSFFAFRRAPDRRMALAGLVGGIIVGIMSLWIIGSSAVLFVLTFTSHSW